MRWFRFSSFTLGLGLGPGLCFLPTGLFACFRQGPLPRLLLRSPDAAFLLPLRLPLGRRELRLGGW